MWKGHDGTWHAASLPLQRCGPILLFESKETPKKPDIFCGDSHSLYFWRVIRLLCTVLFTPGASKTWKTVRIFTYQEHLECLAPPLGDKIVPSHWPQGLGLQISKQRRVPWLPPGWGQACRSGWRPTIYISPEEMGSKAFYNRTGVERALGNLGAEGNFGPLSLEQ